MYHWLAEDQTMELACNTIDEVPEDLVHLKTFQKYLLGLCQNRGEKKSSRQSCAFCKRQIKSGYCDNKIHTVEKSDNKCDQYTALYLLIFDLRYDR